MGAISASYNNNPEQASQALNMNCNGFYITGGGGGVIILEEL